MTGCIYKYVCGFLHWYLASLTEYICMWIFKIGKFEYIDIWQVFSIKKKKLARCWNSWKEIEKKNASINMYVDFYIDIWQVWWNIYVCGFLKLANLSTLIFDRFFLKKKKNWQVVEIVGKKLKKKIHPGCWNSWKEIEKEKRKNWRLLKIDHWNSWIWKSWNGWIWKRNNVDEK